ncbi:MAG TPA: hypothetical protein DDZ91_05640 [Firmicutes bacterium]|nr:hypothetical protein [Bacillota bacterium]
MSKNYNMSTYSFTQKDAPLFENFLHYSRKGMAAFHTPGHRGGRGCEDLFRSLGGEFLRLDLTELKGANLDQDPDFLIKKAEELAAEAFGAKQSYFLVNGASIGIMAALLALKGLGKEILIARNCHLSVINGLILSGLKPVFISPTWVEGLPCLPSLAVVTNALKDYPDAAGVFLTNPGYHGIYGPLGEIAKLCKAKKVPLLLDEAHGGYLKYINNRIEEASTVDADLWVWGTHKMMGSLTQTGMLHLGSGFQNREKLEDALELLSSTSPSYLLLASLDSARRQLYLNGRAMFTRAAELSEIVRQEIINLPGLKLIENCYLPTGYGVDPTKIILSLAPVGWSGIKVEEILRQKYLIQPEYADRDYVYIFVSYAQERKEVCSLIQALTNLATTAGPDCDRGRIHPPPWNRQPLQLSPSEAVNKPVTYLNLQEVTGKIAAGWVAAYPPGIPLWVPGEQISSAMVEWLISFQRQGGYIRGLKKNQVKVIQ